MRMAEQEMDEYERKRAEEWAEYLAWFEDERKLNELNEMGQPSPANDGILKGNENGFYSI